MASKTATVSFGREELVKLRDLHRSAWGYYHNPTADKLERAIARIDARQENNNDNTD